MKPTLLGRAVDRGSHSIPGLATQLEHAPIARSVLEDSNFPFVLNFTLELSLPKRPLQRIIDFVLPFHLKFGTQSFDFLDFVHYCQQQASLSFVC